MLDDVSIHGAQGVLINITGGMDLAIDEVHQISTIIQEEAGDEAEIILARSMIRTWKDRFGLR